MKIFYQLQEVQEDGTLKNIGGVGFVELNVEEDAADLKHSICEKTGLLCRVASVLVSMWKSGRQVDIRTSLSDLYEAKEDRDIVFVRFPARVHLSKSYCLIFVNILLFNFNC